MPYHPKLPAMRLFTLLSCLLFVPYSVLLAQPVLKGTVLDSTNHEPVPFVTVYFDGTTNGQTTDDNGQFALSLNGIDLPAVLVVSHVGYRRQTLLIRDTEEELYISLAVQGQLISTVVVQDRNQRLKNIQEFRRLFLGTDEWGERAQIRNEDALLFDRDFKNQRVNVRSKYMRKMTLNSNRNNVEWSADSSFYVYDKALNLQATAKVPLEIELPDLGYKIQVDLVKFLTEYRAGRTSHLGHYFFIPQEGPEGKTRARHERNRQRAFYNSSLHFLRSLYAGKLKENGYQIYEQEKDKNGKNKKLKNFDIMPHVQKVEEDELEIKDLAGRSLIILYYGDAKGRPLPPNKWRRAQPVQSGIHIGHEACLIRPDGTVGDSDLAFSGYIGSRGVAWILPSDFDLK